MASRDNVFSVFENYVNKEDVSFQYDDIPNTTDSSKEQIMSSENAEEIIDIEENIKIPSRARRAKKRNVVQEQYNSSNDSIDLTEFSSPIKSKRLKERAGEAIDLCEPSSEIVPPPKKGRSNKSAVKARKVSYKKALAASHLPLPAIDKPSKAKEVVQIIQNVMPAVLPPVEQQNTEEMYDLTGDVELTSEHSSAPLFQKSNDHVATPTVIIKEHNTSQEFDYDFDSISVNVKINGKISKFVHKSADLRFYDLFKTISQKEKVAIDNIFIFNEKEKRILPDETPKGVGHSISAIYTCRLMNLSTTKVKKQNLIDLKFQSDKWKTPITLKVSRVESFESCIKTLCKEVKFKPEQFSLEFDGDALSSSSTPMDLDFEGGEILDCRIKV